MILTLLNGGRGSKSGVGPKKGKKGGKPPKEKEVKDMTLEEAIGLPGMEGQIATGLEYSNPNYDTGKYAWTYNCQRCVWAYELIQRGYNVTAAARPTRPDQYCYEYGIERMAGRSFTNVGAAKVGTVMNNIDKTMANWGEGSRAFIVNYWKGGGGHIYMVERKGGQTRLIDPQPGRYVNARATLSNAHLDSVKLMRVDDININSIKPGDLANVVKKSNTNISHRK